MSGGSHGNSNVAKVVRQGRVAEVDLSGTPGGQGGPDPVFVSAYAELTGVTGSSDSDMKVLSYMVEMLVGPLWLRLVYVSPIVTITGYHSPEADEADLMAYDVYSCTWEFPEVPPQKIKLRARVGVGGGENAFLDTLASHLVARGMLKPDQDFGQNS